MTTRDPLPRLSRCRALWRLTAGVAILFTPLWVNAQARKHPSSRLYVSDVSGDATIEKGEAIEDLAKRSVHEAQGTVIETRKPTDTDTNKKVFSALVFSNGTGAFFDADTKVEMKRFLQEPFTPNRNDLEVEPSISQTQAFVSRGVVGLCNSKLVAGSNMNYATPHGSVNIRGRKIVIEALEDVTRVSMLEGDSTVRGGPLDLGGHILRSGEQALIRRDPQGGANKVQIRPIPREEAPVLDEKVAIACTARKTVYFEARETAPRSSNSQSQSSSSGEAAGASTEDAAAGTTSAVNAFDATSGTTGSGGAGGRTQELFAVEILPTTLPVEFTISNASLPPTR